MNERFLKVQAALAVAVLCHLGRLDAQPRLGVTAQATAAAPVSHDPAGEDVDGPDIGNTPGVVPVTMVPLLDGARAIAQGRGVSVSAEEVYAVLREAPQALLQRYATVPGALDEMVEGLVSERLLALEARRRGLENDPVVRAALERALVARLRSMNIERAGVPREVTEAEVEAWYNAHPERFHIPERRRVRVIFSTDRAEAQTTLRLTTPPRMRGRAALAYRRLACSRNHDPALVTSCGELAEVTRTPWPNSPTLDPALRDALFEIAHEGDVLTRLIPALWNGTPGFFVARLVSRRPAIERSLSDSADWIRHRIVLERRVGVERAEVERIAQSVNLTRAPLASVLRLDPVQAAPSPAPAPSR